MNKLYQSFLALTLVALSTSAQAQNRVINDRNAQVRKVADFHAIRVSDGIHLYLTQGNDEAVAVSASQTKYRDLIRTEVDQGVLRIYFDHSGWTFWDDDTRNLKAYVSCKLLDAMHLSSGSRTEVDGSLSGPSLSLKLSSGAVFTGSVNVNSLTVEQGSGAEATIAGTAVSCQLEASSGSVIKAHNLQTDQCDATTSSGGSVEVTVNKELIASAHSGGQIHYQGSALIKEMHSGSGGEISKR
jgi:Putative auto-transporter adhesin, head GIN domain